MESAKKSSIGCAKKASTSTTPESKRLHHSTTTTTPNADSTTYEENLKKQIYFLELETRYMKEKIAAQNHARASFAGGLTPPHQLSAPSTPLNQVQSHVPPSGVVHNIPTLRLTPTQVASSPVRHIVDLSAHLPASMSGTSMPSTPTAVLHTPSETGNGIACPPTFTSPSLGHPPPASVVSRHNSLCEVASDVQYPSQTCVSIPRDTSPSPSSKSSLQLAPGQDISIHGEVSAHGRGSITATPLSDRSSLPSSPCQPTAPTVVAEVPSKLNIESKDTQVEALVIPHAEGLDKQQYPNQTAVTATPLQVETNKSANPLGPTRGVVGASTNTNEEGHEHKVLVGLQVTPCSDGPSTLPQDSTPYNRTFVQKMHSAIQTHVPKCGVGIQFQSPSQAATTQTSIVELVLNGTQTTPCTTPRENHDVPPLPASHAPSTICPTSPYVSDHMDDEANSLATLSSNIVQLKERFVQREDSHKRNIMQQHENFERAKQSLKDELMRQLEDQKRETERQIDILNAEYTEARDRMVSEIIDLQKVIESDRLKISTLEHELQASIHQTDAQFKEICYLQGQIKSLESQVEQSLAQERQAKVELEETEAQLSSSKMLLKEYKIRYQSSGMAEPSLLRQEIRDLESDVRRMTISLKQMAYERSQETEQKRQLEEQVRTLSEQEIEYQQKETKWTKSKAELEGRCSKLESSVQALEEERETLRTQVHTLKRVTSEQESQLSQAGSQPKGDGDGLCERELQIHRLNEELQRAHKEAAVQEEHYLSIDGENTAMRKENWLLREDKNRLGQTLAAWKARCEELELLCRETKAMMAYHQQELSVPLKSGASPPHLEKLVSSNFSVACHIQQFLQAVRLSPAKELNCLAQGSPAAAHMQE